ncbi:Splicing factor-like protein [Trema orientale]|uniref:Splicing factor-like protein n=1 Tax=Trema orientale TaxID=63057 RepID=A0A2P5CPK2_TREOI|nr:Splicing factor-like protein [Trema orientale]
MAASLREVPSSFLRIRYTSRPNPYNPLFSRGFSSKLFVKGISFSTTEETLAKEFSRFGEVVETNIVMGKTRNRSKGYGYVSFAKEDDAHQALIDMNGKVLDGRVVFVDKAWPSRNFRNRGPRVGEPSDAADG